jgi:hypothetical protein
MAYIQPPVMTTAEIGTRPSMELIVCSYMHIKTAVLTHSTAHRGINVRDSDRRFGLLGLTAGRYFEVRLITVSSSNITQVVGANRTKREEGVKTTSKERP